MNRIKNQITEKMGVQEEMGRQLYFMEKAGKEEIC